MPGCIKSGSIMAPDPDKIRAYRGCFKIWFIIGYFPKPGEMPPLTTQNPGTCRKGVSEWWCNEGNPLIFGITGLEYGFFFPRVTYTGLVFWIEIKDLFFGWGPEWSRYRYGIS